MIITIKNRKLLLTLIFAGILLVSYLIYSVPAVKFAAFRLVKLNENEIGTNNSMIDTMVQREFLKNISPDACITRRLGRVRITIGEKLIFYSKPNYWVYNQIFTDMDSDNYPEICLVVWKSGSYGAKHSILLKDDSSIKCHLFFYEWNGSKFKPFYCTSNLPKPVMGLKFIMSDKQTPSILRVSEGKYQLINVKLRTIGFAEYYWNRFGLFQWKTEHFH